MNVCLLLNVGLEVKSAFFKSLPDLIIICGYQSSIGSSVVSTIDFSLIPNTISQLSLPTKAMSSGLGKHPLPSGSGTPLGAKSGGGVFCIPSVVFNRPLEKLSPCIEPGWDMNGPIYSSFCFFSVS